MNKIVYLAFCSLFIMIIAISNVQGEEACETITAEIKGGETGKYCVNRKSASVGIQAALNDVSKRGGGTVYLDAKHYVLDNPLYLREGVSIQGKSFGTEIEIDATYGFTQDASSILTDIGVTDLTLVNMQNKDKTTSVFYLQGHQRSRFERLSFFGFEKQTLFYIAPNYKGTPARNAIFNRYRDFYADACGKCVVYSGEQYSVISNNVWENIIFRKVFEKAIEAIKWADSEKWYNLYAQAWSDKVILIDLNVSEKEWLQIDRFHFYSPTLVYSPNLKTSPVAIRFGKDTMKHFFWGVISDKRWGKFIADDNARSYYIIKDSSGKGFKEAPGVIKKGFDE